MNSNRVVAVVEMDRRVAVTVVEMNNSRVVAVVEMDRRVTVLEVYGRVTTHLNVYSRVTTRLRHSGVTVLEMKVQDFVNTILAVHNDERHAVGVPPLVWNNTLAAGAKAWAESLAAAGKFEHIDLLRCLQRIR